MKFRIVLVRLNDVKSIWNMQQATCTRGDVTVNRYTQLYSTWCSAIVDKVCMHKSACSHMRFPSSSWGQNHQFSLMLICSMCLCVLVLIKSNDAVAKLHLHNAAVTRKSPFCLFRFFECWLFSFWTLPFHCFSFSTWEQYQSYKHWSILILTRY